MHRLGIFFRLLGFVIGCYKLEKVFLFCIVCVVIELNGLNQYKAISVHRHIVSVLGGITHV